MRVMSLGFQTDIALRVLEGGEVSEHADCLVLRSPANPDFRWGNFLLLRGWPRAGETRGWVERFHGEFPGAKYVAIGVDVAGEDPAAAAEFREAGFSRDVASVLTATAVQRPRYLNDAAECRPLRGGDDWRQAAKLAAACNPPEMTGQFLERRMAARRQLTEDGHGAWFGAFLDGQLLAHLGIFRSGDGVARYQDVETHPDVRRRGLAGTLLSVAGGYARDRLGARTLVIVADPDADAIRLYRSTGFSDRERQVSLERVDPKPPSR